MSHELVDVFLKAAGDPDANVRKAAAIGLGRTGGSHATVALVKLLKDKVWQVREEAIHSLGALKVTEASDHLLKIIGCKDKSEARKAILHWAAAKGGEQAAQRKQGAVAMTPGGAKKPEEEPWQVKKASAIALCAIQPDLAANPLISLLNADNPSVRTAAMVGLANIQAAQAVEPLIDILSSDDWNMRKVAATILGKLKAAAATPLLIKLLDDDRLAVRIEAVIALNHIKPPEAVEILSKTVTADNNYDVRKTAATALGNLRDDNAAPALMEALKDDHWMVRKAAIDALTNMKVIDAIDSIAPFLADEREELRAAASASLIVLHKLAKARP